METKANGVLVTKEEIDRLDETLAKIEGEKVSQEICDHGQTFLAIWTRDAQAIATSVTETHAHKRALISQLLEKADKQLGQYVDQVIPVVHFMAHEVSLPDMNTGELVDKIRIVMKLADGTTVDTFSASFMKGFRWLAVQLGDGPWDPPLQLKIKAHKSKVAGVYYTCSEDYDDTPKVATVSAKKRT